MRSKQKLLVFYGERKRNEWYVYHSSPCEIARYISQGEALEASLPRTSSYGGRLWNSARAYMGAIRHLWAFCEQKRNDPDFEKENAVQAYMAYRLQVLKRDFSTVNAPHPFHASLT